MNPLNLPSVWTIDCQYLRPEFAASFLMVEKDQAAFVDTNTTHSVPLLIEKLRTLGLSPEAVSYLIITHVHLDHAGGASALLKLCPNATLLAHPKAARHMIDPSKLVTSAKKVYGEAQFDQLYGAIDSIPKERVQVIEDGEVIAFGTRTFQFFYTRGHANHHFCIWDSASNGVFTGDSFGLAYPALQKRGLFIFPSTSPTDFDPDEARLSLEKIKETGAERAFLTHFGEVSDLLGAQGQLLKHLEFSQKLLEKAKALAPCKASSELTEFCEQELRRYFQNLLEKQGLSGDSEVWDILKLDLELNAAGIAYVASRSSNPA